MTRMAADEEMVHIGTLALLQQTAAGHVNLGVPESFPLEIAPGIFWLGSCLKKTSAYGEQVGSDAARDEIHSGVSAYLVVGEAKSVLIDTGHIHGWPAISEQLDHCLGARQLDFVMPSHPEIPHGGNLGVLLDKYPGAVAIGDMRDYHLYFPQHIDRLRHLPVGDRIDLGGGYAFRMVDAVIRDMPNSRWGYEEKHRVLFVADGFAYLHHPELGEDGVGIHGRSECGRVSTGSDPFPTLEDILYYCGVAFYWSRFRDDSDAFFDRLVDVLDEYPANILAPAHGNVVADLGRVVPLARRAHAQAFRGRR